MKIPMRCIEVKTYEQGVLPSANISAEEHPATRMEVQHEVCLWQRGGNFTAQTRLTFSSRGDTPPAFELGKEYMVEFTEQKS